MKRFLLALSLFALAAAPLRAHAQEGKRVDFITPHVSDSHTVDYPWPAPPFYKEWDLPRFKPVQIGKLEVDLSPTKHAFFLGLVAVITCVTLVMVARRHKRQVQTAGSASGFPAAVEWLVLYLRNEIILPNVGPHGEAFVPFCLSLFFFILTANFFGLMPWGSTITGNISVTATLAILSFLVIEIAGMRALGWGYLGTIVYWPHDMSIPLKSMLTLIMTPIEIIGKFTKPFALAIRLFANMTGGHIVVLAFIGMVFTFGSWYIAPIPVIATVALMFLEILVALLQAFVFMLLTAVFIGQVRVSHH